MPLNPQLQQKLSDSKFSSISKLIAFEQFQKQKQQRKQIQQQRKNIQLNVAHLYRQAKRASKQLNKTQVALIQNLNKKSTKQEEQRLRQQYRRLKEQELHQLKNNNSLSRYMNMLKRQQAKRRLVEQNKQMSMYIKQKQKHDQTLKKIKQIQQNKMTYQKNLALQNNLKVGLQLAKTRSLYEKKCLSSSVRNQLLQIQNKKIQKQKSVIQELTNKKKQLKELFSKAKQQSHKYQTILDVSKAKPFIQMYQLVAAKQGYYPGEERKRKKSYKKKKGQSQRKIKNTYLGFQDD